MAILEDLVFRCLWTLNISVGETEILPHREILTTVLAMLEVFRYVQYCTRQIFGGGKFGEKSNS